MNFSEQAFVCFSQVNALTQGNNLQEEEISPSDVKHFSLLTMQEIIDTIRFPLTSTAKHNLEIINQNLKLRSLYREALLVTCIAQSKAQIAASSDRQSHETNKKGFDPLKTFTRKEQGYELKFVFANDSGSELFVIVKLDDCSLTQQKQGLFLHCQWQHEFNMVHLTHTSKGKFQTLIDDKHAVYPSCFDPSSEWFIN